MKPVAPVGQYYARVTDDAQTLGEPQQTQPLVRWSSVSLSGLHAAHCVRLGFNYYTSVVLLILTLTIRLNAVSPTFCTRQITYVTILVHPAYQFIQPPYWLTCLQIPQQSGAIRGTGDERATIRADCHTKLRHILFELAQLTAEWCIEQIQRT